MPDPTTSTSSYTMGYSEEFRQLLNRRSAETHAARLLPHLKSGLRALDFGCGPGTITVGLAKAVEPGEVHGIDMEESHIGLARSAAADGGHDNATFHVGDVTDLPLRRQLLRCRTLPCRSHARSRYPGRLGRGEASFEVRRHHLQP